MANFIDLCLNISGNYNEFILEQKDFFFFCFSCLKSLILFMKKPRQKEGELIQL